MYTQEQSSILRKYRTEQKREEKQSDKEIIMFQLYSTDLMKYAILA